MYGYQSFLLQDLTEALPRISNSIKSGDFTEFDVGVRDASGAVCALTESAAQVCIDELVILCTHFSHRLLSCDNHITGVLITRVLSLTQPGHVFMMDALNHTWHKKNSVLLKFILEESKV